MNRTAWIRRLGLTLVALGAVGCAHRPAATPPTTPTTALPGWVLTHEDDDFPYVSFTVGAPERGQPLPMYLALHYMSASMPTTLGQFASLPGPARVIVPRGQWPYKDGFAWWVIDPKEPAPDRTEAQRMSSLTDRLMRFTQRLTERHPTQGRPFVMGLSQGGDLSLLLALRYPMLFQAALPIAARLPSSLSSKARCDASTAIPIEFFHGEADTTAFYSETKATAEALEAAGCFVRFHTYPGVAHDYTETQQADVAARLRDLRTAPRG
ncbi:hypothetical protein HPC49_04715 [Pyxidicoccus fallax]|uniref:Phospholipase/carboxylesterase/thioesterase domain-containing protein n=1 Tax=Pyxidicoccus fallax TaxID=394095 RepID=A0A848LEW8_9BACT|nr:dienelactone hydrolase family protein [Pyxidicoccus fallax]NMO16812.1 hypothetical protein [Pyxidicoccus fallax]NPC77553.1 hypothetical protein [Pyxidicoccus fallax]